MDINEALFAEKARADDLQARMDEILKLMGGPLDMLAQVQIIRIAQGTKP